MVDNEGTAGVSAAHADATSAVGAKRALNHKVVSEDQLALKQTDHLQVHMAHDRRRTRLLCRIEKILELKHDLPHQLRIVS